MVVILVKNDKPCQAVNATVSKFPTPEEPRNTVHPSFEAGTGSFEALAHTQFISMGNENCGSSRQHVCRDEFPDSRKSSSGEQMPFGAMSGSETLWAGCFL